MTYVDQKGKMLERGVELNVRYGCVEGCEGIERISKYEKMKRMMSRVKVEGERMSGGERQVANIIGGVIQRSGIVILDEPTNALDVELKREVIKLIEEYKKEKECIIIISHDKEVFGLFDETIYI
jgi:ABC-type lipoprotein export system ATPase subunit